MGRYPSCGALFSPLTLGLAGFGSGPGSADGTAGRDAGAGWPFFNYADGVKRLGWIGLEAVAKVREWNGVYQDRSGGACDKCIDPCQLEAKSSL